MKKSIALFILFFAISFTANAQSDEVKKEVEINAKAKSDLHDLLNATNINGDNSLFRGLNQLFIAKHEQLTKADVTAEEKAAVSRMVQEKLIGSLTAEQYKIIADSPKLFKKLISE